MLLDKDFNPKLSDFGLAREGPAAGRSHVDSSKFARQLILSCSCMCKLMLFMIVLLFISYRYGFLTERS